MSEFNNQKKHEFIISRNYIENKLLENNNSSSKLFKYCYNDWFNQNKFLNAIYWFEDINFNHDFLWDYFNKQTNFYKSYSIWYIINIIYFRQNKLSNKNVNFINNYQKKIIFLKKFRYAKRILLDQEKTVYSKNDKTLLKNYNINILSLYKLLNTLKSTVNTNISDIKRFKIDNLIDNIIDRKESIINKISFKLVYFKSKFNDNLNEEYNTLLYKNINIDKLYIIYKYTLINKEFDNFILNYIKYSKNNKNYYCVVCLKIDNIIFCKICNNGVHKKCYGLKNIEIDEEDWICDTCILNKHNTVECYFCCNKSGLMKQFKIKEYIKWFHISCLYWFNYDLNKIFITNKVSNILNKYKFKDICFICKSQKGYKIKCFDENCDIKFHPECKIRLLLNSNNFELKINNSIFYFCHKDCIISLIYSNKLNNQLLINELNTLYKHLNSYKLVESSEKEKKLNIKVTLKILDYKVILISNNLFQKIDLILSNLKNNISYNLIDIQKEITNMDKLCHIIK